MEEEKLAAGGQGASSRGKFLIATVKGDVHDIGKNIVGVVLQCNNFEVIDLGVMVSADQIIEEAKKHDVDMIGLSGLITPSLDEMITVAREMKRQKMTMPLLIGGATTSAKHTAVKIAPVYEHPVVHVVDASRSVGVVERLLSDELRDDFVKSNQELHEKMVASYQSRNQKLVPYADALQNRFATDWENVRIDQPSFTGTRVLEDFPLEQIREYIDWSPFFMTWELKGKYPKIFNDATVGAEAKRVYDDANALLDQIIADQSVSARAVFGFWPAASDGDDVIVYAGEDRQEELARFHFLRQQWERKGQKDYRSLADYVAPKDSGRKDYVGGFVATGGIGAEALSADYKAKGDDYNAIMVQAIADRLAEAFAELLHQKARQEWSYGAEEGLSKEQLIAEEYRGIRPAAGYPACPDHTEKRTLFDLLDAEAATSVELTSSFAMTPAAAVSGLYFAHPDARYFAVDRITRDQAVAYAARKGRPLREIEKWLSPNLAYEPD